MIKKDRSEELRQWLGTRPELSINALEKSAEIPQSTLAKVVSPTIQRSLPRKHWEALEVVLRKYGWK